MKIILIILSIILFQSLKAQYVVHWEATNQTFVQSFQIQKSMDNTNWQIIKSVATNPTKVYNDSLSLSTNIYYRVTAITKDSVYATKPILIPTSLPIKIKGAGFQHIKINQ